MRTGLTKGSRRPPLDIFDEILEAATNSSLEGFLIVTLGCDGVLITMGAFLSVPFACVAACLVAGCLFAGG